jgi:hypothetical protein
MLKFSMRRVQFETSQIARQLKNQAFIIPASRLHQFETKDVVPSIHRIYSLARVYLCRITDLLEWYGIPHQ